MKKHAEQYSTQQPIPQQMLLQSIEKTENSLCMTLKNLLNTALLIIAIDDLLQRAKKICSKTQNRFK